MRKSTLFISAVLTTFVLAMLAGAASAYQNFTQTYQAEPVAMEAQPQVQTVAQEMPAVAEVADVSETISTQDAITLAADVLGQDDLFSIEMTELNGEEVYLVTFTSGDLVYISLDGQIRSVGEVEVQTVVVNVSSGGGGGGGGDDASVDQSNNSSNNSGGGGGSHEEHEEHEDHEDHEDHEEHDD